MSMDAPLFAALCEALPPDVRLRPDVTSALRGVLIGSTLRPKAVEYEDFVPHPADAELVEIWLQRHPRLRYDRIGGGGLDVFALSYRTWFQMTLSWARNDLYGG